MRARRLDIRSRRYRRRIVLRRLRIAWLAYLLARSDADKLYSWAPRRLRASLERRFIRRYGRYRTEVLASIRARHGRDLEPIKVEAGPYGAAPPRVRAVQSPSEHRPSAFRART